MAPSSASATRWATTSPSRCWRHNSRAYLDVGTWAADLMLPLLNQKTNHATDPAVQAAWKKALAAAEQ